MKQFIVRIGCQDYTVEKADAVALLDIASRMKAVKQNGYQGPYYVIEYQTPWLDNIAMADVAEPEPEPDKFSSATKAAITF
jgi:hypothetical protein